MTPEQVSALQAMVDEEVAVMGRDGLVGKVRQHAAWTDPETGETHGPHWVIEVRDRQTGHVVTIGDLEDAPDVTLLRELLRAELGDLVGDALSHASKH